MFNSHEEYSANIQLITRTIIIYFSLLINSYVHISLSLSLPNYLLKNLITHSFLKKNFKSIKIVSIANCARLDKLVFQTHAYRTTLSNVLVSLANYPVPQTSILIQVYLLINKHFSLSRIYHLTNMPVLVKTSKRK